MSQNTHTHKQENKTTKKLKKEEMNQELGMAVNIYNPSSKKAKEGKEKVSDHLSYKRSKKKWWSFFLIYPQFWDFVLFEIRVLLHVLVLALELF